MRCRLWISFCLAAAATAYGQKADTLPLPIASPRAIQPGTIVPLTAGEKVTLALKNTFGIRNFGNRVLAAGLDQWSDHPEEWPQGMKGYGHRLASRWGRSAVRSAIQLSTDVAFKTDPRYDRCDCVGFRPRTGHALKRILVDLRDDGGQMISVSSLAGAYVTPMISDQWYPDRLNTWDHKLKGGTTFLAWRGATNMLREFWPDIRQRLRRNGNAQK